MLNELESLEEWPDRVKKHAAAMDWQTNGTIIHFDLVIKKKKINTINAFTTRPDTLMGVTMGQLHLNMN